jgi:DNA mismatch repair protein MutS
VPDADGQAAAAGYDSAAAGGCRSLEARYEAVGEAHGIWSGARRFGARLRDFWTWSGCWRGLSLDSAGARDVRALAASLSRLPGLEDGADAMQAARWQELTGRLDTLEDVTARISTTLVEEPPLTLVDGGAIAAGVDAELDELRTISTTGRQQIAAIEERERQRTGITSLKVRYNSVFGYYIEITKANMALAPADYERKQTLVNAERFTTPELKEYERKILTAHDRSIEIEKRIFAELRRRCWRPRGGSSAPRLRWRRRICWRTSRIWLWDGGMCGQSSTRAGDRSCGGRAIR